MFSAAGSKWPIKKRRPDYPAFRRPGERSGLAAFLAAGFLPSMDMIISFGLEWLSEELRADSRRIEWIRSDIHAQKNFRRLSLNH